MLSHPIFRTAAGLLAAGALIGGLAPVVLARGASASARGERAHALQVVDRVEDRFEQASMQEASKAHADVDKANADADEHGADADDRTVKDEPEDDEAREMARAEAIEARIESAEQAAMARERDREARIRAMITQFMQQAR